MSLRISELQSHFYHHAALGQQGNFFRPQFSQLIYKTLSSTLCFPDMLISYEKQTLFIHISFLLSSSKILCSRQDNQRACRKWCMGSIFRQSGWYTLDLNYLDSPLNFPCNLPKSQFKISSVNYQEYI